MNPEPLRPHQMDYLVSRYEQAMREDDFDVQTAVWELAETRPDLEAALLQVHQDLLEEQESESIGALAQTVQTHLSEARLERPAGLEVTLREVAETMIQQDQRGWGPGEHALNERVRSSLQGLPPLTSWQGLLAWAAQTFGAEAAQMTRYWQLFSQTARRLEDRAETDFQVAARRSKPATSPPPGTREDTAR